MSEVKKYKDFWGGIIDWLTLIELRGAECFTFYGRLARYKE